MICFGLYQRKMQKIDNEHIATFCISLHDIQRRLRDSNPRYPLEVYTLSRRAPSTTRTSLLLKDCKNNLIQSEAEDFFGILGGYFIHLS